MSKRKRKSNINEVQEGESEILLPETSQGENQNTPHTESEVPIEWDSHALHEEKHPEKVSDSLNENLTETLLLKSKAQAYLEERLTNLETKLEELARQSQTTQEANYVERLANLESKLEQIMAKEKTDELNYDERISNLESAISVLKEFSPEELDKIKKNLEDIRNVLSSTQNLETRVAKLENASAHSAISKSVNLPGFPSLPMFYLSPPKEAPTVPFNLETLLKVMVKHNATDLHIKPGSRPVARLDGELIPVGNISLSPADTYKLVFDAMPEGIEQRFQERGFADFAISLPEARFRINAYREQLGVSAAIRMLRTSIPSFEELNLPPVLRKLTHYNHGLILVTGPAGNGKSTTLAAMIQEINSTQKKHIVTIEDPVEFVYADKQSFITQREIGTDAPSFFDALKQALRQDPNVILIGEMRDPETIWTAVMAAETGHLVFSTLHTPNTIQAIDRILDPFPKEQVQQFRRLLARTLRAIVSLRLLPRKDGAGRVPAVEVMISTPTIASLIAEGQTSEIYQYIAQGQDEGMQTFTESLAKLYQAGLITKEVALHYADSQTELRLEMEGHTTGGVTLNWK
jgi:twitching motility protein PilT